ncbi:DinB family protein [Terrabacter sp. GCM10028922]|uniref:DinB family protein n=1 Tax=Terrabacter sp. GCM10028922 TaxID=3273428 RepID=UPI00361AE3AE
MAGQTYPDMWVDPEDDPRSQDAVLGDERATLLDYLRSYRLTLEMKCSGLTAEQLAMRSVPPSTMSLLGLVRHLAHVEQSWFRRVMAGEDVPYLYRTDDRDADFNGAVGDDVVVAEAWERWREEVANAEAFVDRAESLDLMSLDPRNPINLREVLVHMIEEYARHCGHADLLRECIDGRTGQ